MLTRLPPSLMAAGTRPMRRTTELNTATVLRSPEYVPTVTAIELPTAWLDR